MLSERVGEILQGHAVSLRRGSQTLCAHDDMETLPTEETEPIAWRQSEPAEPGVLVPYEPTSKPHLRARTNARPGLSAHLELDPDALASIQT